ncbi:MAG: hypothetical protein Q4D98_05975 [Planctomycetia bacterium]|nr:hypothetical protein [Planctomycetia bacterium]
MKKTMFLMCAAALILVSAGCCNDRQNTCSRSWNPFRSRSCQQQVCYPVVDAPVVDDCFSCGTCSTTVAPSTGCSSCTTGSSAPIVEPAPL